VAAYDLVGRDYHLNQGQKLRFIHSPLHSDAERFYLADVKLTSKSYGDSIARIRATYHSAVHQNQAQNALESLRMATHVSQGIAEQDASTKTIKTVANTSQQLPASHMGDEHRVCYLTGAMVGYAWVLAPLSCSPTSKLGFQKLCDELQSALLMNEGENRAELQEFAATLKTATGGSPALDVLYGGLSCYANNRKGNGDREAGKAVARFNALSLTGCRNC